MSQIVIAGDTSGTIALAAPTIVGGAVTLTLPTVTGSLIVATTTTAGSYMRGNGTNVVMSAIQAADVPTLNQNTTGSSTYVASSDSDPARALAAILPNTTPNKVRFDFANGSAVDTPGSNYAGVMTYAPWSGTTASTGDASYQLAFGSTAANGGGSPSMRIRNGIDTTWNTWKRVVSFSSGVRMIFAQSAAPTGWTQVNNDDTTNRMIRVVNTAGGGVGGTDSPIVNTVVTAHTHAVTTDAASVSHTHTFTGTAVVAHTHSNSIASADISHSHGFTGDAASISHTHGFTGAAASISHSHTFTGAAVAAHDHIAVSHNHNNGMISLGVIGQAGGNATLYSPSAAGVIKTSGTVVDIGTGGAHTPAGTIAAGDASHSHTGTIAAGDASHSHTGTIATGGATAHTHTLTNASAGAFTPAGTLANGDASHSHTASAGSTGVAAGWVPRYIDTIICSLD